MKKISQNILLHNYTISTSGRTCIVFTEIPVHSECLELVLLLTVSGYSGTKLNFVIKKCFLFSISLVCQMIAFYRLRRLEIKI